MGVYCFFLLSSFEITEAMHSRIGPAWLIRLMSGQLVNVSTVLECFFRLNIFVLPALRGPVSAQIISEYKAPDWTLNHHQPSIWRMTSELKMCKSQEQWVSCISPREWRDYGCQAFEWKPFYTRRLCQLGISSPTWCSRQFTVLSYRMFPTIFIQYPQSQLQCNVHIPFSLSFRLPESPRV